MKIIMNDTPIELNVSTLELALSNSGVNDIKGLAVAVNDTIIPRAIWSTYNLNENDTITIIRATQGG
ncbi:MAG TPA: sulfur carrier protein ThiS [Bacteroidia bacterium]|nr:sulfur carrier protein ThiS [Bacteroidia bacterium]